MDTTLSYEWNGTCKAFCGSSISSSCLIYGTKEEIQDHIKNCGAKHFQHTYGDKSYFHFPSTGFIIFNPVHVNMAKVHPREPKKALTE